MKKRIKENAYKYLLVGVVSLLISGASVILANEHKKEENDILIEQITEKFEREVEEMGVQIDTLQENLDEMKDYIKAMEDSRKKTYIITKEAPVFREKSSLSQRLGTFPINSVVMVSDISEDGIWLECEQGYFKIYNAIALINAQDTNSFVEYKEEEKQVASTQPTEEKKTLVNADSTIVGKSNLTLEQVEILLSGSPMSGHGKAILEIEEKYKVNAFFTVAVAQNETQRGKTGTGSSKKNPFGITQKGNGYRTFSSYSEAIYSFGDIMNRLYIPNGRTTIEKVNEIYCPGNSGWGRNVRTIMNNYYTKLT